MNALEAQRFLGALFAPPRCSLCTGACLPAELVCADCGRRLEGVGPGAAPLPGVGPVSWAAAYEGVARELVGALKFQGRLGLATVAAGAIAAALPAGLDGSTVVAVPAAPLRRRRRGFDPAETIALALADRLGLPLARPLARSQGRRQVGRRRAERRRSPPRVWTVSAIPQRVLLVDDVLTTGATLASCAEALRAGGCAELRAAVFARALGRGCGAA